MDHPAFLDSVLRNEAVEAVWRDWEALDLPECWMVAGCLAQTIWNLRFSAPPAQGISDIDLVYFDPDDLTEASEQRHAERIRQRLSDLGLWIDVKNEARVHLWYAEKFGFPITLYQSVMDAIDTFPTTATAVGIRPNEGRADVYATFGLDDLVNGIVRANKRQITREIYEAKVNRWLSHWPDLDVVPWGES